MENKNISLVTGGAGFIGKNLVEYLALKNLSKEIIVVDNFITSDSQEYEHFIKNLKSKLRKDIKITEYLKYDICENNFVETIKKNHPSINEIYHLASLASPPAYKTYPLETLDVGYIGTKNILELTRHYDCKVLFTSSSEVYGDAIQTPQNETYYGNVNSFGPRSCYDESKRVAETLVYCYNEKYNLKTRIARIFNTFGPHMSIHDGRIVTEIIKHLLNNTELTIYGDGNQTRSVCYVYDTVDMLVRLMNSDYSAPVNIGNSTEMTINELVELIKNIYQKMFPSSKDLKVIYKELTKDDPKIRNPCLKLNKEVLGETTYTTLEEGIQSTIESFSKSQISKNGY